MNWGLEASACGAVREALVHAVWVLLHRNPNNRFYVAPDIKITHYFKCAGFEIFLQHIKYQVRH